MAQRKSWLPREGFTFDVVQTLIKQTLLNPTLTLPLWLLSHYSDSGRGFALDHPTAIRRLRLALYLGLLRQVNNALNRAAAHNWTRIGVKNGPQWDSGKELVLVTGGSDGIGKVLVNLFAAKGVRVVVLDVQEPKYAIGPNSNIHFHQCDLADPSSIVSVSADVRSQHGDPTVLVLNAGIINRHSILALPDNRLQRVFAVNTLSHYRLAREFLPAMIKRNHGFVATTASLAAFVTVPGMVDYNGTKAAALAFHEGLTAELAHRYGAPAVRTLCLCPNFAATKLSDGFKNRSTFLNPTLSPETVAELEFDRIWAWEGGVVSVPASQSWISMTIRAWPEWMQHAVRGTQKDVMSRVEKDEMERLRALKERQEQESEKPEGGYEGSESVVQV